MPLVSGSFRIQRKTRISETAIYKTHKGTLSKRYAAYLSSNAEVWIAAPSLLAPGSERHWKVGSVANV